jgi:hypothetical protein
MSTPSANLTDAAPRVGAAETLAPYAVSILEACRLLGGMSRAGLYVAIGRGELEALKSGRRTLITTASIERRQRSLPAAKIKAA